MNLVYVVVGLLSMIGVFVLTRATKDKEQMKKTIGFIFIIYIIALFVIKVFNLLL